jgi:prevent-host-death family protein
MVTSTIKDTLMEVKASDFKARCLKLMEQVAATREPLLITKNGKPIAQLGPVPAKAPRGILGLHPQGRVLGDIVGPAVAPDDWDALR